MSDVPVAEVRAEPSGRAPVEVPPPMNEKRVRSAGALSLVTYAASHALRLCNNLILTRLLFSEAFGVMALVTVFLQGLQLFSDIGIRPAIVQNPRGEEPEFRATAFTMQVFRGFALYAVAVVFAKPFAHFYEVESLAELLPIAALNAVAAGFASTKFFTLQRQLAVGRLAVVEIGSQVIGLVSTVMFALAWRDVWALVWGSLVATVVRSVLGHVMLPGPRDRFGWNREDAKQLYGFGRWIFISTALGFLGSQSDRLIFGKLLSLSTLGVYNIALLIATTPSFALASISQSVMFPVLSRAFEHKQVPTLEYKRLRRPLLLVGGVLTSGIAGGAPIVIDILYDDRYLEAGAMLRVLGIGSWMSIVEVTAMYGLLASGRSKWLANSSAVKLLATSLLIPFGYSLGGIEGALCGLVVADLAKYSVVTVGLRQAGLRAVLQDLRLSGLWLLAAGAGFLVTQATSGVLVGNLGLALRALLVAAVVAVVWGPLALSIRRERRGQAVSAEA